MTAEQKIEQLLLEASSALSERQKTILLSALGGATGVALQSIFDEGKLDSGDVKPIAAWMIGGALPAMLQGEKNNQDVKDKL
jgi:hypothetical protein